MEREQWHIIINSEVPKTRYVPRPGCTYRSCPWVSQIWVEATGNLGGVQLKLTERIQGLDTLGNALVYYMLLLYFTWGCTGYIVESILKVNKTSTLPLNRSCPQCSTQKSMLVKTTLQCPKPSTAWGESQVYTEDSLLHYNILIQGQQLSCQLMRACLSSSDYISWWNVC